MHIRSRARDDVDLGEPDRVVAVVEHVDPRLDTPLRLHCSFVGFVLSALWRTM
jgi:hypothetical protein